MSNEESLVVEQPTGSASGGTPVSTPSGISLRVVGIVLAFACGLTVANIYYVQPLLDLVSRTFGVSQGTASVAVTLTQLGYAVGLFFVVPLGDLVENRGLVTRMLLVVAVALALAGLAPNATVFFVVCAVIGVTSVTVQVLVPLAAHLAPPGQSGRFVGLVMSGLLLGIMLARTVSSGVAQLFGWRAIYWVSAVLMVLLSVMLRRMLPRRVPHAEPGEVLSYRTIMASLRELVAHEPVLVRRALCQGCMFAAFTAYWTAIGYELIDHHGFDQGQIALFALVGAGGAVSAPFAGRLADHGWGEVGSGVALVGATLFLLLAGLGHGSWVLLAVAAFLLDFAVQAHQIMSQHAIYRLRPSARGRINTVFMTTVFVFGTVAAALTGWIHDVDGWSGVTLMAAGFTVLGLLIWLRGVLGGSLRSERAERVRV